ncbi:calcium-independent phospholipase A2-gamma isoform X1 [Procambarus clarkii]|uniref:calcium-independent phospholipase A2-gamma isoform X1 n=2 Tax=Procambarus clarkii TaxID=6728 RepID=UPI0037437588
MRRLVNGPFLNNLYTIMASGGSSLTQWRLWTQLRDYIARTTTLTALQRDLPQVIKKFKGGILIETEANLKSGVNKFEGENGNEKEIVVKPVDINIENSSELQKVLKTVNSYIPLYFSQVRLNFSKNEEPKTPQKCLPKWQVKKDTISKASIDARTRFLVKGLGDHLTEGGRLRRLEDLCNHLRQHPQAKGVAVKRGGIQRLLRILERTTDSFIECEAREALALLGYTSPVKGHGIRLLTIDGGGVRGLVALEVLRKIEAEAGHPIHELFDYICGVSTGAILAVMMGVQRLNLDKCETLYRELSTQIFTQTTFKGATSLFMRNSYYDSNSWTDILKENMGTRALIETARDTDSPKICLVATSANTNRIQAYLFRNYNLPYRVTSHYQGTSSPLLWEAVRASAAAPGYFSEFRIGDLILLDGGLFVNNPTAIAVHEAKQLWPDVDLQCVVSIGTGRHEPIATTSEASISWATRIRTVLNSATDTEGVHTTMHDLLPGDVYYRFNPYLSDEIGLDEIGEERLGLMMEDTRLYLRKNEMKIQEAARSLNTTKSPVDRIKDWYKYQLQLWPSP